jgi:hypothetical protein
MVSLTSSILSEWYFIIALSQNILEDSLDLEVEYMHALVQRLCIFLKVSICHISHL